MCWKRRVVFRFWKPSSDPDDIDVLDVGIATVDADGYPLDIRRVERIIPEFLDISLEDTDTD
jgi:hypothetical protein